MGHPDGHTLRYMYIYMYTCLIHEHIVVCYCLYVYVQCLLVIFPDLQVKGLWSYLIQTLYKNFLVV